jgi:lysophospholipase L1-like esterase
MRHLAGAILALTVSSAALAAPPAPGSTYVAMGSSYAAGTSLPKLADDSPARCGQGSENYPRQVARALNLKLVDRSCGGAVTPNILEAGQFGLPRQIDGMTADARLVTVTIGGNDVRFVADLGRYECLRQPPEGAACPAVPAGFELEAAFATLATNLRALAREIRARAPAARVVFVDYIQIVPAQGTCDALGLDPEGAADMRARAQRLAALTTQVAAEAGFDLVQASRLSQGHDVCSADPWGWGRVSATERERGAAVANHPRLKATTAIAEAVVARLRAP